MRKELASRRRPGCRFPVMGLRTLTTTGALLVLVSFFFSYSAVADRRPPAEVSDLQKDAMLDSFAGRAGETPACACDSYHGFGYSVASGPDFDGDGIKDFIVSAPFFNFGNCCMQGKVYIFSGADGCLIHVITAPDSSSSFGYSIDFLPDQNGDGIQDMIVGAPFADVGSYTNAGRVYVYSGEDYALLHVFQGSSTNMLMGKSVAGVPATGYGYILIGSPGLDDGKGVANVYRGGTWQQHGSPIIGEKAGDSLGLAVAYAGTIDSDRKPGALIGAPFWDSDILTNTGKVRVIKILSGGWGDAFPLLPFRGASSNELYGFSLSSGNFNDFGADDFVIGAPGYLSDRGCIFVYQGGTGTLYAPGTISGENTGDKFGSSVEGRYSVCLSPDRTGILVGAPGFDSYKGKVYAYRWSGPAQGFEPCTYYAGTASSARLGTSIAGLGDINGDNFGDILTGMPRAHCGMGCCEGWAVVLTGNVLPAVPLYTVYPTSRFTITSPKGGKCVLGGSIFTVTWQKASCYSCDSILLELSYYGGGSWSNLDMLPGSATSYDWSVPDIVEDNCLIRLTDWPSCQSVTSRLFQIHSSCYEFVSPDGETWNSGSLQTITWSRSGELLDYVMLFYAIGDECNGTQQPSKRVSLTGKEMGFASSQSQWNLIGVLADEGIYRNWRVPYFPFAPCSCLLKLTTLDDSLICYSNVFYITDQSGMEEDALRKQQAAPLKTSLIGNYPNPFNPSTEIRFSVAEAAAVKLEIYNVLGQKVATLVDEIRQPGVHRAVWDGVDNTGKRVSSGLYVCRYVVGTFVESKKVLLLK